MQEILDLLISFLPLMLIFFNIFSLDFDFENFFHFLLRKNFLISEIPTFNEGEREREREREARDWLDRIVCSLDAITRDLPLNFNLATSLNHEKKGIVKQFN